MAEASIPVDLFNPGQVFACLGFLEAAEILVGEAEGGFDWSDPKNARFHLRTEGPENPVEAVLAFLDRAHVKALAPADSDNRTEKWGIPTAILDSDHSFPFPDPSSPATLPAVLEAPLPNGKTGQLVLEHFGEAKERTKRDPVKFWGGAGGYPAVALAKDALDLIRGNWKAFSEDPFSFSAPMSSSFRLDWRRDYIPIDAGFSLNRHNRITPLGFPIVELLAAIGLTHARPEKLQALEYRYGVIGHCLVPVSSESTPYFYPAIFLRAALGGGALPFERRVFRMLLGWPAKEGQARAITTVIEENIS